MKIFALVLIAGVSLPITPLSRPQEKSVVGNTQILLVREGGARRKIYLTSSKVTYIEAGKTRWSIYQFKPSFKFNDAALLPNRVLVSLFSDQEKTIELSAHSTQTGRMLWDFQGIQVCGQGLIQLNHFDQNIIFESNCFEALFNTFAHILKADSGVEIAKGINTTVAAVASGQILVSYGTYVSRGYHAPESVQPRLGVPLYPERFWTFTNGARPACGPLTVTGHQWAAGEYVYSANQDRCGRYTLRFHWTDRRHSAPEVIAGWPLGGPSGQAAPDNRLQDRTLYLWRGQWEGGPQSCPMLPQVADCPSPEQRVRPTRY